MPFPASYQTSPGFDVIAVNGAFARAFPGVGAGGNVMVWMLVDPRARVVMEDWEREAHIMVQAFRHMAAGFVDPGRIAEITRMCAESPDWERLWGTDISVVDLTWRPVRIRPLEGG